MSLALGNENSQYIFCFASINFTLYIGCHHKTFELSNQFLWITSYQYGILFDHLTLKRPKTNKFKNLKLKVYFQYYL
jgi:hypothetical protein